MACDLIQDLSSLTQIKYPVLSKLANISENCICDYILDAVELDEDIVVIDVGIGWININILNDEIEYKFIPNKRLEKKILRTIENEKSPLVTDIEAKLNKKIVDTYKELL